MFFEDSDYAIRATIYVFCNFLSLYVKVKELLVVILSSLSTNGILSFCELVVSALGVMNSIEFLLFYPSPDS